MPIHSPLLPELNDDELRAHFGADTGAQRRYQLLHTVLVLGTPQREAAETLGVSERTVRNALRSFKRGGLSALKSRRAAARRESPRRWETFEPALAAALAEEPQAGGDRLWRRAQALLGDAGSALSRRTAYRILARLRAEAQQEDDGDDLTATVRAALPFLMEDPPLTLGGSALAQRLLPLDDEPQLRGALLQQALRAALDRLRPAGDVAGIDRSWWPYLICSGEYEAGQSRGELQRDLALSASTYSRAKRQGLVQIANVLPRIVTSLVESPAARAGQRLPRSADFVGRRDEQSYYAWRLQAEGVAWIWGLPGSGKTALAAELAAEGRRYGQTIAWHTCRPGLDGGAAALAGSLVLALGGVEDAARAVRRDGAGAADPELLIELLRDRLAARPSVIVIDDIHHATAGETGPVFDALLELVRRRAARLLLVGRERPADGNWPPLPGLGEPEARLLWAGLAPLPAEQWAALHDATAGLPQPLRLVAAAYHRAGELARPDDWRDYVAAWADDAFWDRLPEAEQQLLVVARALEGRAWGRHTRQILHMLDIPHAALERARAQGLVSHEGERLLLHAVLRAGADTWLRDDARLRLQLAALSATIAEAAQMAGEAPAATVLEWADAPSGPESAAPPASMELLVRLREALADSADYLKRHPRDRAARRLASQLAWLQAALPDPIGAGRVTIAGPGR